jgi:hypothetical protein
MAAIREKKFTRIEFSVYQSTTYCGSPFLNKTFTLDGRAKIKNCLEMKDTY